MRRSQPPFPPNNIPRPEPAPFDVTATTEICCEKCKNQAFDRAFMLRHVSEINSPTGEAGMLPIPVFSCRACGHVNSAFVPDFIKAQPEQPEKPEGPQNRLIKEGEQPPYPTARKIDIVR